MKVKYKMEDFFVEEILKGGVIKERTSAEKQAGKFAVYRVEKKGIDTLSVIYEMSKSLGIPRDMFSSCGLKDKYSVSVQHIAVDEKGFRKKPPKFLSNRPQSRENTEKEKKGAPMESEERGMESGEWRAELVGQSDSPLRPRDIYRNFFRIVLRDIHPDEEKEYDDSIKRVSSWGFPNYFDEQRFGSARHFADERSKDVADFIGKRVLKGDYEGALKIHFQAVSDFDRSRVKKFKKIMREKWGNWAECLLHAQDKNDFRVLRYLLRKNDFKGAFDMLDPRLARLYLEVYQDYIFNEVLARIIKISFERFYKFPYFVGEFVFPLHPPPPEVPIIKNLRIPLPHPSAVIPREIKDVYDEVLREERVKLSEFRSGLRKVDFVRAERNAWEIPEKVEWKFQDDEEHEGKRKLEISFYLKPGVFATMFIKNITPLLPVSETEKKPIPVIYTKDGKEIKVIRKDDVQAGRRKKVIILS